MRLFLKSSSKLLYKGIPHGIPYLPIFVVKHEGAVSTTPSEVTLCEDFGDEPVAPTLASCAIFVFFNQPSDLYLKAFGPPSADLRFPFGKSLELSGIEPLTS